GSTSRISEPVTGRQERSNSSTRSHDPTTNIWKEIRHDYLEETSGCACLGARRDRAGIAKLRPGSRPPHRRERSYDSLGATDPAGAVGKPDSGPALGSRAGTHHQRADITARVPGPDRNRAMTPCRSRSPSRAALAPPFSFVHATWVCLTCSRTSWLRPDGLLASTRAQVFDKSEFINKVA